MSSRAEAVRTVIGVTSGTQLRTRSPFVGHTSSFATIGETTGKLRLKTPDEAVPAVRTWNMEKAPAELRAAHRTMLAVIDEQRPALDRLPHPAASVNGGANRIYAGREHGHARYGDIRREGLASVRDAMDALTVAAMKHGERATFW